MLDDDLFAAIAVSAASHVFEEVAPLFYFFFADRVGVDICGVVTHALGDNPPFLQTDLPLFNYDFIIKIFEISFLCQVYSLYFFCERE